MICRFLGILLAASMAHLAIAESDLVCATHGHHTAAPQQAAPTQDMHHHDGRGESQQERCKVPARADCCEAMTTCASSAAIATVVHANDVRPSESRVISFVPAARQSLIIPPDPPPPRA
jgi:hypothetical protein